MEVDLSIAIVSYNTRDILLSCLRSVLEHTKTIQFEIVVVDNDSKDGTVSAVRAHCPIARIIVNPDNRGFSKAVNQALAVSRGRHLLMLNSDTEIKDDALGRMVAYLDHHPDIGAVSCKQWTEDGRLCHSCFEFPSIRDHLLHAALFQRLAPNLQSAIIANRAIDCTKSQDVDWINGACLMVRRDLMNACGGLDEGYFMYFEDIDLCRAIRNRGYRIRHVADGDVIHLIGRSGEGCRAQLHLVWEFSRIRYVEKHFPWFKRWIMKGWIAAGTFAKLISTIARPQSIPQGPSFGAYLSIISRVLVGNRRADSEYVWAGHDRG